MKKIQITNIPKGARFLIGFDNTKESGTIQQRDIIEQGILNTGKLKKEFKYDSNIIIRIRKVDWVPFEINIKNIKSDIEFKQTMRQESYGKYMLLKKRKNNKRWNKNNEL